MPTDIFEAALRADAAFDAAIKTQFGPKATRWDHHKRFFSLETLAAFQAKIDADAAVHAACDAARDGAG